MSKDSGLPGLQAVARQEVTLETLLEKIPVEHRGVLFERVLEDFHPQENTRRLELAFAEVWAERNNPQMYRPLLPSLLETHEGNPRKEFVPATEREWQVACLVAATLFQFLPTTVGCNMLYEGFRRAGGKLWYELPET